MIRVLVGFVAAIVLHLLLGWVWSIGGGVAVGLFMPKRAWLFGGISVAMGWTLFVVHSFIVAPEPTGRLMVILGDMFGEIPSVLIPALTILIGALLGISGGVLGTLLHPAMTPLVGRLRQGIALQERSIQE